MAAPTSTFVVPTLDRKAEERQLAPPPVPPLLDDAVPLLLPPVAELVLPLLEPCAVGAPVLVVPAPAPPVDESVPLVVEAPAPLPPPFPPPQLDAASVPKRPMPNIHRG
jgi:translation initiation factor IF-2